MNIRESTDPGEGPVRPIGQLSYVLTGLTVFVDSLSTDLRLFPDDPVLFVEEEEFFIGLSNVENGYNVDHNPVATVPAPLSFIRCSRIFSLRYNARGSRAAPARNRASAASARVSVRKQSCSISCAVTV